MTLEQLGFEADEKRLNFKREKLGDTQRINIQERFKNITISFGRRANWYELENDVIIALSERIKELNDKGRKD